MNKFFYIQKIIRYKNKKKNFKYLFFLEIPLKVILCFYNKEIHIRSKKKKYILKYMIYKEFFIVIKCMLSKMFCLHGLEPAGRGWMILTLDIFTNYLTDLGGFVLILMIIFCF